MSGGVWAKKLPLKMQNRLIFDRFIVSSFFVWFGPSCSGRVFDSSHVGPLHQQNNPLSYASLVDAVISYHDISYDPTLQHIEIDGKMNDKGFYHHYSTGRNRPTVHCYQV